MNILVTGATGFLGKHIIEFYRDREDVNLILVGRNQDNLNDIDYNRDNFRKLDLLDKDALNAVFAEENIDYVIHSAAKSNDWGDYDDFYRNNVTVTENIAEACKNHNVKRLVHVSTPSIYFEFIDKNDIEEYTGVANTPVNHYAATKLIAENVLFKAYLKDEIDFIGLRPRGIYGEYDQTIFPKIIRLANKGPFPLTHDGEATIDITYAKNVVHAIDLAIKARSEASGGFYNITDGSPKRVKDILDHVFSAIHKPVTYKHVNYRFIKFIAGGLEKLSKLTGKEPLMTKYSISLLAFDQTLNIDKAKEQLGYEPQYTFEQGVQNFIEKHDGKL